MKPADYDTHMAILDRKIEAGRHDSQVRISPLQREKVQLTAQKIKADAKIIPAWTPWARRYWSPAS